MNKSRVVFKDKKPNINVSRMVTAFKKLDEKIDTEIKGQFNQTVIIKSGNVTVKNSELDCEFETEFDDDTAANEAEIIIYNLTDKTINQFKHNAKITITAGYGTDTGVIFSGFIVDKETYFEDVDKVTVIRVLDDRNREEREIENISYSANTKASYILKDLCGRVGLPIAVFKVARDYTYTDEVTVDGDLFDKIKDYAEVCGVSAYICKSKLYVRSLKDGDNTHFKLSAETGLLSVAEFEKKSKSKEFGEEVIKGFKIECLLQHRIQTASIIELDSKNYKGKFRVKSGEHHYNGSDFITKATIVQV